LKTWQIFVFTLIPLALVFAGVVAGSLHGTDSQKEVFPTPPARPAGSHVSPAEAPSGPVIVSLASDASLFDASVRG
jgi:hypothetical protein